MNDFIIFCAKYLFIVVALLFLLAWARASRKEKLKIAVAVIIAGIIALILDKLVAKLYYDPRPFTTHHIKPLVAHAADNGFPSEHTAFTMTLSMVLIFYRPKLAKLSFALALLVGIGRVAAHVHSPIDIIGGIAIGLVAGYLGYYLTPRVLSLRSVKAPKA